MQTTPVGAYPAGATPEGLMDMAGNVWEWCENLYGKESVWGKEARSLRGGSWGDRNVDVRCSARINYHPVNWLHSSGFRVVVCQS